jgi:hypothetical protein
VTQNGQKGHNFSLVTLLWARESFVGTSSEFEDEETRVSEKNLHGKTRQEVEAALRHKSRSELIDLIHSLVSIEQLLKPSEIAARSCINKRAVLRDIRDGKFGDYYCRAENSLAVPLSGVNQWRRGFRVPAKVNQ